VLVIIITIALLMTFIGKFFSNQIFMGINKKLHDLMVGRVMNAKIEFFEENTQGRIINRFSKDI